MVSQLDDYTCTDLREWTIIQCMSSNRVSVACMENRVLNRESAVQILFVDIN